MSMKEKLFALVGFSAQRHSLKTEVISGLTTFITMSYILALLPAMFTPLASKGFPVNSLFTAIALATIVGTLLMAFLARRPFGQAPGLTLNLFFIETICISLGYPWQFALTAVLLEGLLFGRLTLRTPLCEQSATDHLRDGADIVEARYCRRYRLLCSHDWL